LPYCRRCGNPLDEDARFCPKCGTSVVTFIPPATAVPAKPPKPLHKDPLVLIGIGLIAILLSAVIIAAVLIVPISTWSYSTPYTDSAPGVRYLNLNFHSDVGRVNIMTTQTGNNNILIYVSGNGSRGIFGGSNIPLNVTFSNQTVGDTLTVDSSVTVEGSLSAMTSIDIQIFVNPNLNLNLNVTSNAGKVSFNADKPTTIQALRLQATTGEAEAHLQSNVTLAGNITLSTTTGAVNYRMSETSIVGNNTLALHSTTGAVTMDITQTKTFQGNLAVDAETTAGSINLGLGIDGGVAAKIISQAPAFGDINTKLNNFQGNKTQIQSLNYPAASNIEVINRVTGFGSINVNADYRTAIISS
jgi:predicted membrane protein